MMRVIYAGTPEFAAVALQALLNAGVEIPLVLTQPDRPAGRGMQLQPSAVKQLALAHAIPVAQPTSLKLDGKYPDEARQAHAMLTAIPHDIMVVAAYGLLLPASVLAIPPLGCLNIHGSLLPRWRGAAPIHRAIEAGDTETGITIMQMELGLDTGPMICEARLPISATDTTARLHDKLAEMGGQLIVNALHQIAKGEHTLTIQPTAGVTYAAKISKNEAALDFAMPAEVLERKIRAFNPFPGTTARYGDNVIKIWQAELAPPTYDPAASGTIVAANAQDGIAIACAAGTLRLTQLQKPGGKRLSAAEFLQGFPLHVGAALT